MQVNKSSMASYSKQGHLSIVTLCMYSIEGKRIYWANYVKSLENVFFLHNSLSSYRVNRPILGKAATPLEPFIQYSMNELLRSKGRWEIQVFHSGMSHFILGEKYQWHLIVSLCHGQQHAKLLFCSMSTEERTAFHPWLTQRPQSNGAQWHFPCRGHFKFTKLDFFSRCVTFI